MNDSTGQAEGSRKWRRIVAIGLVVAVVALIPIAAGFVLTSGSSHTNTVASDTQFQPVAPATASSGQTASNGARRAADHRALVASLLHATTMRQSPSGKPLAQVGTRTGFGSPTTFLVARRVPGWLGVISTDAGNNRVGWVRQSAVSLRRANWQLRVSLSAKRLTVFKDGKAMRHYEVAIGRPDAPTPTGRFAVTDRLATHDPAGPYGCCILALSAHSPHAIQGWSGGNRIAIHSTPDSSSIGQAVSHGCVRVSLADGRWLLAHIPLGTPTVIRS